eukprot:TRINITY_DN22777_c0_g1_i1.p1 TRINITY_DN22777_c0_g1~~TRINITY_DN22777_c0_g1_i1.p1  ORF type:complete len:965 (-),score=127.20 TRINITY_DN22777_c0_g1_i1:162-3056(-)
MPQTEQMYNKLPPTWQADRRQQRSASPGTSRSGRTAVSASPGPSDNIAASGGYGAAVGPESPTARESLGDDFRTIQGLKELFRKEQQRQKEMEAEAIKIRQLMDKIQPRKPETSTAPATATAATQPLETPPREPLARTLYSPREESERLPQTRHVQESPASPSIARSPPTSSRHHSHTASPMSPRPTTGVRRSSSTAAQQDTPRLVRRVDLTQPHTRSMSPGGRLHMSVPTDNYQQRSPSTQKERGVRPEVSSSYLQTPQRGNGNAETVPSPYGYRYPSPSLSPAPSTGRGAGLSLSPTAAEAATHRPIGSSLLHSSSSQQTHSYSYSSPVVQQESYASPAPPQSEPMDSPPPRMAEEILDEDTVVSTVPHSPLQAQPLLPPQHSEPVVVHSVPVVRSEPFVYTKHIEHSEQPYSSPPAEVKEYEYVEPKWVHPEAERTNHFATSSATSLELLSHPPLEAPSFGIIRTRKPPVSERQKQPVPQEVVAPVPDYIVAGTANGSYLYEYNHQPQAPISSDESDDGSKPAPSYEHYESQPQYADREAQKQKLVVPVQQRQALRPWRPQQHWLTTLLWYVVLAVAVKFMRRRRSLQDAYRKAFTTKVLALEGFESQLIREVEELKHAAMSRDHAVLALRHKLEEARGMLLRSAEIEDRQRRELNELRMEHRALIPLSNMGKDYAEQKAELLQARVDYLERIRDDLEDKLRAEQDRNMRRLHDLEFVMLKQDELQNDELRLRGLAQQQEQEISRLIESAMNREDYIRRLEMRNDELQRSHTILEQKYVHLMRMYEGERAASHAAAAASYAHAAAHPHTSPGHGHNLSHANPVPLQPPGPGQGQPQGGRSHSPSAAHRPTPPVHGQRAPSPFTSAAVPPGVPLYRRGSATSAASGVGGRTTPSTYGGSEYFSSGPPPMSTPSAYYPKPSYTRYPTPTGSTYSTPPTPPPAPQQHSGDGAYYRSEAGETAYA